MEEPATKADMERLVAALKRAETDLTWRIGLIAVGILSVSAAILKLVE